MHRVRAAVVVAVLVFGSLAAATTAVAAAPTGSASGTVTGDGGLGVAGVRVLVLDGQDLPHPVVSTVTDAHGEYLLTRVPADTTLYLCFDASGAQDPPAEGYLSDCGGGFPWGGPDDVPRGGLFSVERGHTYRVDVTLGHGGGITGRITATDGSPLAGVVVRVSEQDFFEAHTTTAADGTYHLRGVIPGSKGVCFDPGAATGGPSSTGYLSECYDGVLWSSTWLYAPQDVTPIRVRADVATTGIDAVLGAAGVITGTVRADAGGAAVRAVQVTLDGSDVLMTTTTSPGGAYRFAGLRTGADYVLCVKATIVAGSGSGVYQPECWHDKQWDPVHGDGNAAPDSDPVTVTEGRVTRVDVGLAMTGHIAGTVTNGAGAPIPGVSVDVYRGTTSYDFAVTDASGHYDVVGVAPTSTGYSVCFNPGTQGNATRAGGYRAECYDNQYLTSPFTLAPTATPVPVPAGGTATVDAQLAPGAEFTGTVTAAGGGGPVGGVQVVLFDDAGVVVDTESPAPDTGRYDVAGLAPRRSYRVCVLGADAALPSRTVGHASQCDGGTTWSGALAAPTGAALPGVAGRSTRVDFALTAGASISGSAGARVTKYDVFVFDAAGHRVGTVPQYPNGRGDQRYGVGGLTPETGPYRVCFGTADGRPDRFGVVPFCWNGTAAPPLTWDGADADLPAAATVAVTAGAQVTAIDGATFAAGGAITGKVLAGTAPAVGTAVLVFAPTGSVVRTTRTSATGTFVAAGLNPATGPYRICATAPSGFRPQCWRTAAWSGSGGPPAGAAVRPVASGRATAGTDIRLPHV